LTDDHDAPVPSLADDNTLVLLGAGASAGAGFPTSAQLHEILRERLDPLYANLASLVFQDGGTVDPERVFRVLEFLNCLDNPTMSFTNELGSCRTTLPMKTGGL
jgi:NAD-dependent SIR2 family protein deacetylase